MEEWRKVNKQAGSPFKIENTPFTYSVKDKLNYDRFLETNSLYNLFSLTQNPLPQLFNFSS